MDAIALLKNWNLYSNRIVKHISTFDLRDFFLANPNVEYELRNNINFMYNDGVETTLVVNLNDFIPDYLIVADQSGIIKHTWFILECTQISGSQYKAILKRDLINDFYEQTLNAPCFVEKAKLPVSNPLIFNSEGMRFNQIKNEEYLLKDKSKVAWIVGYVSRPNEGAEDITIRTAGEIDYDATLEGWEFNDVINRFIITSPNEWIFSMPYVLNYTFSDNYTRIVRTNNDITEVQYDGEGPHTGQGAWAYLRDNTINQNVLDQSYKAIYENAFLTYSQQLKEALANLYIDNNYALLNQTKINEAVGKILYSTTEDKYYRVGINEVSAYKTSLDIEPTSALGVVLKNINDEIATMINASGGDAELNEAYTNYGKIIFDEIIPLKTLILQEISSSQLTTKISVGRNRLNDAPYDMFCIPYGEINIGSNKSSQFVALKVAQKIAEQLGSNLYDMQLLPYCPYPQVIVNGEVNLSTISENIDYNLITTSDEEPEIKSIILWCKFSNGRIIIPFNYFVKDVKLENECDTWRIVSPNYQGIFEFSASKNNGIEFFQVDYTYRPYNPYIHVAPNWGGLYGANYNDARGLICGGDFSVAIISDAFRQYEINNKNYQNIFDRQIKNLDVQRRYQLVNETMNAITGTAQGAVLGGVAGGVGGAIAGGVASAIGGVADIGISQALYKENKSYQTDLFNYNLQNVKALPDSLSKISSITYNNKLFPFVEYYTCTEEEKDALRLKLKYNGMTVMKIDKIKNYIYPGEQNFIQGQIIRIENLNEEDHVARMIYEEIKKGVFL